MGGTTSLPMAPIVLLRGLPSSIKYFKELILGPRLLTVRGVICLNSSSKLVIVDHRAIFNHNKEPLPL